MLRAYTNKMLSFYLKKHTDHYSVWNIVSQVKYLCIVGIIGTTLQHKLCIIAFDWRTLYKWYII